MSFFKNGKIAGKEQDLPPKDLPPKGKKVEEGTEEGTETTTPKGGKGGEQKGKC